MLVIRCGWCQKHLGTKPSRTSGITHGMCQPCQKKLIEEDIRTMKKNPRKPMFKGVPSHAYLKVKAAWLKVKFPEHWDKGVRNINLDRAKAILREYKVRIPKTSKKKLQYRSKNPRSGPVDQGAARELENYITSSGDLYRQQMQPILKNLVTKRARGIYKIEKAVKLWMHLVDNGARKYIREFGVPGSPIDAVFNRNTRLAVAKDLEQHYRGEMELGNYDSFLPKKYRKNPYGPKAKYKHIEKVSSKKFAKKSFRVKKVGTKGTKIIVACPKGYYHKGRCSRAMHLVSVLKKKRNR